jgi:hypothetical protein
MTYIGWPDQEVAMLPFPLVERYRAELRSMPFERLHDAAAAELRRRLAGAHASSAIEGIHPTPELEALFAMFVEERAPAHVLGPFVDRYIAERFVPDGAATAV